MISFNLRCQDGHVFEAWFKDGATFDSQAAAKEVVCPICGDRDIVKAPMAPNIVRPRDHAEARRRAFMTAMQERLAELRAHIEGNFDYVGDRFAEEARKIHYGETERRDIYGEASDAEAKELEEEGIAFARIPWLPRTDS